ncbi:MAG: DUF6807 family protein [Planctomycetaceae bacterium]
MLNSRVIVLFSLVLLVVPLAGADDAPRFKWTTEAESGTTDLSYGNVKVIRYMHQFDRSTKESAHATYKVYHHVFGPGGGPLITKGPGGLYTHHRGLYVGWNKTGFDGTVNDFWHCRKGEHIRHIRFLEQSADSSQGRMTAEIHWVGAQGKQVIQETRTVSVSLLVTSDQLPPGWQIDWRTKLESRRGNITLQGDRQHAGFQFRAAQEVAAAKGARYIRPVGFPEQSEAFQVGDKDTPPKHVDLDWLAMTFQVQGKRYTVEYFADPDLPKPSRYSERPYGRFGAYFKTTLTAAAPLEMRYRLHVTTGTAPDRTQIQKRYDAFLESLQR